jgi:hypothetical protein
MIQPLYTCSRCQCDVHLDEMDKNQKNFYFQYGFCKTCQHILDEEKD